MSSSWFNLSLCRFEGFDLVCESFPLQTVRTLLCATKGSKGGSGWLVGRPIGCIGEPFRTEGGRHPLFAVSATPFRRVHGRHVRDARHSGELVCVCLSVLPILILVSGCGAPCAKLLESSRRVELFELIHLSHLPPPRVLPSWLSHF